MCSEIGLGYDDYNQICKMFEKDRFSESMWKSTLIQLSYIEFFRVHKGFNPRTLDCMKPLDFIFILFWLVSTLAKICTQTNLYAVSLDENGDSKSGNKWLPLIVPKLRAWFRVLMVMALKKVPHVHLHWSKNYEV